MSSSATEWEIDKRLNALIGENVRGRAELFWQGDSNGYEQSPVWVPGLVLRYSADSQSND